jgi:hypothetical protein
MDCSNIDARGPGGQRRRTIEGLANGLEPVYQLQLHQHGVTVV